MAKIVWNSGGNVARKLKTKYWYSVKAGNSNVLEKLSQKVPNFIFQECAPPAQNQFFSMKSDDFTGGLPNPFWM